FHAQEIEQLQVAAFLEQRQVDLDGEAAQAGVDDLVFEPADRLRPASVQLDDDAVDIGDLQAGELQLDAERAHPACCVVQPAGERECIHWASPGRQAPAGPNAPLNSAVRPLDKALT